MRLRRSAFFHGYLLVLPLALVVIMLAGATADNSVDAPWTIVVFLPVVSYGGLFETKDADHALEHLRPEKPPDSLQRFLAVGHEAGTGSPVKIQQLEGSLSPLRMRRARVGLG